MRLDFDADVETQAQVILLVDALSLWLKEQPAQVPRPGKTNFTYRPDGTLDSVVVTVADGE